ncbi:MAG: cation:proton antiporter [Alphaproteobacteria bacterium]
MEHYLDQLTAIAMVTTVALLCGLALIRIRQPAIVGYILAGLVLGPTGLGFISNTETVKLLAELGVIMLLFLIGMELNMRSFRAVYKTALATVGLQIAAAFAVFALLGFFVDWTIQKIILFSFATALSSTAVAIKILEETDDLKTPVGRTTISVLIAQDLAVIPMMLIIGAFAATGDVESAGRAILIKLGMAVGLMLVVMWFLSRREQIELPGSKWIISRPEIVPLAAMAFCFSWATLSGAAGLSAAYGAFIAGMIIGNSSIREVMHKAAEPIQAILLMVFFLSVGLLIDLDFIKENWGHVLIVLVIVTLLKTAFNVLILHRLGEPWERSFHSGVVIGQVGEFSFIIAALGFSVGVIADDGYRLMIAVIALSLLISPMWLLIARHLHDLALKRLTGHLPQASPEDL